jgi:hypothetical protein
MNAKFNNDNHGDFSLRVNRCVWPLDANIRNVCSDESAFF